MEGLLLSLAVKHVTGNMYEQGINFLTTIPPPPQLILCLTYYILSRSQDHLFWCSHILDPQHLMHQQRLFPFLGQIACAMRGNWREVRSLVGKRGFLGIMFLRLGII